MKLCLYFTTDLIFSSRVKPLANAAGFEVQFPGFQPVPQVNDADLILFDLEAISEEELRDVLAFIPPTSHCRTLAYAPHVKTGLIESAKKAGVQEVWTRGQFNRDISTFLQAISQQGNSQGS